MPRFRMIPLVGLGTGALLISACGAPRMEVHTDIDRARVVVADASGKAIDDDRIKGGEGKVKIPYDKEPTLIVTVIPDGDDEGRYPIWRATLNRTDFDAMQPRKPGHEDRILTVRFADTAAEPITAPTRTTAPEPTTPSAPAPPIAPDDSQWQAWPAPLRREAGAPNGDLIMALGNDEVPMGLTLSPDGSRLAIAVARFDANGRLVSSRLQSLITAGTGRQQLSDGEHRDLFPAFSSDGQGLIFVSDRQEGDATRLVFYDLDGGGSPSPMTVAADIRNVRWPSQAVDGTIGVTLLGEGETDQSQVWLIGGSYRRPTWVADGTRGRLALDGRRVAYTDEQGDLWLHDLGSGKRSRLTSDAAAVREALVAGLPEPDRAHLAAAAANGFDPLPSYGLASWTPDGKALLVPVRSSEGGSDLYAITTDGRRRLTDSSADERYPVMAPDLATIYFTAYHGGKWGIYRIIDR